MNSAKIRFRAARGPRPKARRRVSIRAWGRDGAGASASVRARVFTKINPSSCVRVSVRRKVKIWDMVPNPKPVRGRTRAEDRGGGSVSFRVKVGKRVRVKAWVNIRAQARVRIMVFGRPKARQRAKARVRGRVLMRVRAMVRARDKEVRALIIVNGEVRVTC